MKLAVLKPIIWNDNGYVRPAGCPTQSGYARDYGYGHEEWNGNPDWVWRGYRLFHTEPTARLDQAADDGSLGMLMFSSRDGAAYAVGVAANVLANSDEEKQWIAEDLKLINRADEVWQTETVRNAFRSQQAFLNHWQKEHLWVRWRCPRTRFHWFDKPIPLDPGRITGKKRLSSHYSSFTQVKPEVILDIVHGHLPENALAIEDWFAAGEFELPRGRDTRAVKNGLRIRAEIKARGNAPTDQRFEYWVRGNRTVEPMHHRLQTRFVKHLRRQGVEPVENADHIDVQYQQHGNTVFSEIKPTENVDTRYAIRAAIGQLFEYRFHKGQQDVALEIVIGSKPKKKEIAFVESLGLRLTYAGKSGFKRAC